MRCFTCLIAVAIVISGSETWASQSSSGSLTLVGRVPEIMRVAALTVDPKFEMTLAESGQATIAAFSAESNGLLPRVSIVSKTKSGVPEYRGVPLTQNGGSFNLTMTHCTGIADQKLSLQKGPVRFKQAVKNCRLGAEWKTARDLPPGHYVMDVIVEMVSI